MDAARLNRRPIHSSLQKFHLALQPPPVASLLRERTHANGSTTLLFRAMAAAGPGVGSDQAQPIWVRCRIERSSLRIPGKIAVATFSTVRDTRQFLDHGAPRIPWPTRRRGPRAKLEDIVVVHHAVRRPLVLGAVVGHLSRITD